MSLLVALMAQSSGDQDGSWLSSPSPQISKPLYNPEIWNVLMVSLIIVNSIIVYMLFCLNIDFETQTIKTEDQLGDPVVVGACFALPPSSSCQGFASADVELVNRQLQKVCLLIYQDQKMIHRCVCSVVWWPATHTASPALLRPGAWPRSDV